MWHTFFADETPSAFANGFESLELLDEYRLLPTARVTHRAAHDAETLTYVREGSLSYADSSGRSGILQAGEFQRATIGRGFRHSEESSTRSDSTDVFRASLRPLRPGLSSGHEQRRFSVAERRAGLCVVASVDARGGSLRLHQDALVYSSLLEPGQHLAYELGPGRSAWLHVVRGEVKLAGLVLTTGDGAGIREEFAVSFTAGEPTEVLLFDVTSAKHA